METKEFRVKVPEGYEIDAENSTLECIKFKPIKRNITYKYVCEKLFENGFYYIGDHGDIRDTVKYSNETYADDAYADRNNARNAKQLKKLLALNQLFNIAEYYNRLHPNKTNWSFCITLNYHTCDYVVVTYNSLSTLFGVIPLFNRKEDAQAVIDNSNFREILDTVYKN